LGISGKVFFQSFSSPFNKKFFSTFTTLKFDKVVKTCDYKVFAFLKAVGAFHTTSVSSSSPFHFHILWQYSQSKTIPLMLVTTRCSAVVWQLGHLALIKNRCSIAPLLFNVRLLTDVVRARTFTL
jgi:hypothetical protein